MRKKPFRTHKKLQSILEGLTREQIEIFDDIYQKQIDVSGHSISKKFRLSETLIHIIQNNSLDHSLLFSKYLSIKDTKTKLEIKYGKTKLAEYEQKLKSRPRAKTPHSIFDYMFWLNRGLSEQESKEKVRQIQSNNAKKRTKSSYSNTSFKLKSSVDYWTKLGYSKEESEILREPFLDKMRNDLDSLIARYGDQLGTEKWIKRCSRYKDSIRKNLANRSTGGYVSKESLRFFIPLYKLCRKKGLSRKDIYFGIKGSKEYFIRDTSFDYNTGKFYDFCIPSLGLIVEYHGTFWHPKSKETWTNPWMSYDDAVTRDRHKQSLAESRDMSYHVVWSDDDLSQEIRRLSEIIEGRYNESRRSLLCKSD